MDSFWGGQATFAGNIANVTDSITYQLAAGVEGDLPGRNWTWAITGQHGETSSTVVVQSGGVRYSRINNSSQAQPNPNNASVEGGYQRAVRAAEALTIRFGVDNVFDIQPLNVGVQPGSSISGNTLASYYDVLGRRYYVAFEAKF